MPLRHVTLRLRHADAYADAIAVVYACYTMSMRYGAAVSPYFMPRLRARCRYASIRCKGLNEAMLPHHCYAMMPITRHTRCTARARY